MSQRQIFLSEKNIAIALVKAFGKIYSMLHRMVIQQLG